MQSRKEMEFLERLSLFLERMSAFPTQLQQYLFSDKATDFLLNPILLRFATGTLHLLLLLIVFVLWVFKIIRTNHSGNQNQGFRPLYHKATLLSCLGFLFFNLVLCAFDSFYWYRNGWSDENILTFLELVVRALAWLALCTFLYTNSLSFGETKYPLVVRVWWGLFFSLSCYCMEEDSNLDEPLLNSTETNDDKGRNKSFKGEETVTPYASAGFFNVITFSWVSPLVSIGYKKILDLEDIPQLAGVDSVRDTFPLLDSKLVSDSEGSNRVTALMLAKGLLYITWKEDRHSSFKVQQAGYRAGAALVARIYNKGLKLSCQSKQENSTGEIINLMSVDAGRISFSGFYMHYPWMAVIQVGLALAILYKNLGLASLATLVASVLVMLVNIPLGKFEEKLQEGLMKSKDERMKMTSEVLRNMRILKLQSWEMKFLSRILDLRKIETGWLRKYAYASSAVMLVFSGAHIFVSLATFGSCILLGIPLESGKVLSALATFEILQEPIYSLPDTISMFVQTKVSLDRISTFLSQDDLQPDVIEKLPTVGSGKSTLLSCILGEVPKISGTVRLCGRKAYVAQSPWIQNGTIEDNILFGKEMEKTRYNMVLEACSLKKDLEILAFGDQTVIGERGINLSGGQKQRQIARALYQEADIYLFDDPFSAVNAHTGTHLFNECILGLLESKTVIFVTHQVEFLPAADLIVMEALHKLESIRTFPKSGTEFMDLVGAHKEALSALTCIEAVATLVGESSSNLNATTTFNVTDSPNEQDDKKDDTAETNGQLVQEEERERAQALFQLLSIGGDYWIAWATPLCQRIRHQSFRALLLSLFILPCRSQVQYAFSVLLLCEAGYKTANTFFNRMHLCLFRAPMSFFDSTPSGRILNRASADQSAVDLSIPSLIGQSAFAVMYLLGTIVLMSQVAWQVLLIFIPVTTICIWLQQYYIPSARELTRLFGVCKAPVIQHFSETLSGLSTIRSFEQEDRFCQTSMKLIDDHSQPMFHAAAAMEWLCIRLDTLSLVTFALSLVFLISLPEGKINPSEFTVAYLIMNVVFKWHRVTNEAIIPFLVAKLGSQYTAIPSEPPLLVQSNRPESRWPTNGEVSIHNLQVRYAPQMPLVLQGLTCTFFGGKKTGIVGRTGSGKSTLIQTLFRIVDPASGQILIDNVDISTIGLHDLRSRLSIIPQDPTMFEGTIRSNMDPLEEYTDEQIWEALDKCHLGDEVRKKADKLDCAVAENGENWSVGQRQLVCLGRVLLKKSKILVLDEATSSVDTATDNLIQQTLRLHFSDSTVITVAHRITSVLDSNMVLLLDQGLMKE
ncbi:ABC transporter C family member 3 [Sesamum angolense]|uniref:ABC-type xenobiotic transporter n=1 Tax=Sesamum angolense TaxID=2727404 RepID=A0AAE1T4M8_9LAMI|nr:ABC transporter C family member 3 [Sesamum angolense]